ncbi:hypothetical protein I3J13_10055 [Agrobacterium sp. MOPV5]|uniref:hypothetical protein n=1 Tax=Agrobacterium leguminum TaxID=2792015 RepID=UPI0018C23CF6|nr:hypothetical protein [Agrobacterium leguminum]MBG0509106.1 hypothetical protein [Agrobacterium leguminum]
MRTLHPVAGTLALAIILAFWLSTALTEISGSSEAIRTVKLAIPWGFLVLAPALAVTGFSGFRMGAKWKHPLVAAKKKRMPLIALNGLLILVPCALVLRHFALSNDYGRVFYAVQALELCAGALNITLLAKSLRNGLQLKHRLAA